MAPGSWTPAAGAGTRATVRTGLFALLLALVALPMLALLINSFQPRGAMPFAPDVFTWRN